MKKKICRYAGCNTLIEYTERYCNKHKTENQRTPFKNAIRSNTNLYNTTLWRKLRKQVLKNMPYCFRCGISIKESPLETHHIVPPLGNPDLFHDINNLVPVCPRCHRIITGKEIRDRKK